MLTPSLSILRCMYSEAWSGVTMKRMVMSIYLVGEVFDPTNSVWHPLSCDVPSSLKFAKVFGHAVLEDKKMILLHGRKDPNLYSCHIESDSWGIYSESCIGPEGMRSSALVDGVLYYVDHVTPGLMFALDLDNRENKPQEVTGLYENPCPPHLLKYAGWISPRELLFSLGNSMLAMVWATSFQDPDNNNKFDPQRIAVHCSKLKMSRQRDDHTGQVTFRTQRLSRSCHLVKGFSIYDGVSVKRQRKAPTASVRKRKLELASTSEAEALWVRGGVAGPSMGRGPRQELVDT